MLEITDLHKRYDDVRALDGLSLAARPGRLLGFLGPNGAGKTTTMRSIFGLLRLDAGTVHWQGREIDAGIRQRFGYMPEQRGLYPDMPVARQLTYLARMHGAGKQQAQEAARSWLERFDLGDRADTPLSGLSHGNQQRVQLAAALVHDPELLVLDEPFSGLDPLGVETMSTVLRERTAAGATVVFSSHQLDLVEDLCDDVAIIVAGRDRLLGSLETIRAGASYRTVELRLADGAADTLPAGAELVATHHGVTRLRVPSTTSIGDVMAHLPEHRVEHLAFTEPRLAEIFVEVAGASVEELEAAGAGAGARVGELEAQQ